MAQIRNVLAAVGQFPQDDPALARASEIARAHRARLTVVHVIDDLGGLDFTSVDMSLMQHQIQLIAEENLEAALARLEIDPAETDVHIEVGSPAQRLTELAEEIKADLLVMRAHQRNSMLEKIVGSTTDRVIRTSRTPVLVVKRPVSQAYRRIVVSIDTADDSASVVPFLAALFPLAGLQLIHVVAIPAQFEAAMRRAGSSQADILKHLDALVSKAKDSLHDSAGSLSHRPERSRVRVVAGEPAANLVRATWSPKVDLVALGPGDTGKLRRALLGSVTQQVLRAATCDVLICRTVPQDAGG